MEIIDLLKSKLGTVKKNYTSSGQESNLYEQAQCDVHIKCHIKLCKSLNTIFVSIFVLHYM